MINPEVKLIAIAGPTASGKTDLSLELAEKFGGEIVCADSRTVYRGLDIGTAKPTEAEQARVSHHLLDIIEPDQTLSAGEFKRLADGAINDIWARGKVPFLVGGSGLYMDAVIYEYEFPPPANPEQRAKLNAMGDDELRQALASLDPELTQPVDTANRRRVIRAIETAGQPRSRRAIARSNTLVIAPELDREIIKNRIKARVGRMLETGFIDEVRRLGDKYGLDCAAFNIIGYRAFKDVVFGDRSVEEGEALLIKEHEMLLKKQLTWFKRHPEIIWLKDSEQAEGIVRQFLLS